MCMYSDVGDDKADSSSEFTLLMLGEPFVTSPFLDALFFFEKIPSKGMAGI